MAKASDLIEVERQLRHAVSEKTKAETNAELYRAFIRETDKQDEFLRWTAKRLGIFDQIYDEDHQ